MSGDPFVKCDHGCGHWGKIVAVAPSGCYHNCCAINNPHLKLWIKWMREDGRELFLNGKPFVVSIDWKIEV